MSHWRNPRSVYLTVSGDWLVFVIEYRHQPPPGDAAARGGLFPRDCVRVRHHLGVDREQYPADLCIACDGSTPNRLIFRLWVATPTVVVRLYSAVLLPRSPTCRAACVFVFGPRFICIANPGCHLCELRRHAVRATSPQWLPITSSPRKTIELVHLKNNVTGEN